MRPTATSATSASTAAEERMTELKSRKDDAAARRMAIKTLMRVWMMIKGGRRACAGEDAGLGERVRQGVTPLHQQYEAGGGVSGCYFPGRASHPG